MVIRWKQLTSPATPPVSVAEAKTALRVVDTQSIATKANRTMGSGNSQILLSAKIAGSIGNQYSSRIIVSGNNTALSVTFSNNLLTINSATDGSGIATSTANDVIAKIYANPEAAAIFDATSGAGNGLGIVSAVASGNLTAGVDSGDEDAYISFLILAVAETLEALSGKVFSSRTFRMFLDEWPKGESFFEIPISPVISVQSIKYNNPSGVETVFTSKMTLDAEDDQIPARLVLNSGETFPTTELDKPNVIWVDFTAGYITIPDKIKQCILFLVAHWYANREPVINGISVLSNKIPFTFETVFNSFRLLYV